MAPPGTGRNTPRTARPGTVYLVGAGPGDPRLLTLRGRALLDDCDAIVYDALANPELIAEHSAAERHFVGKRGGQPLAARQNEINALLLRLAREGKAVVRLKGGDPLVFGRGSEEAQALAAAGIPFEIVPGVTAGVAVPAYAGIPVTHRGVATSVTFVTGQEDPDKEDTQTDWAALARAAQNGTIVLYMGVAQLPGITRALIRGGLSSDTPAAAIQSGTYPDQRTVVATLATIADEAASAKLKPPVISIIGQTVALRDAVRWFDRAETHPLLGRTIVVTRATPQAAQLSDQLRDLGAAVVEMPAMRIEPLDQTPLKIALGQLLGYQHLIFTSQHAVTFVWDALRSGGRDARSLRRLTISAIGPATAESLVAHGIVADVVPSRFVAEGLLAELETRSDVHGARVLYPAAEDARDVLPEGLRALGASVDVVPIYRSVPDGSRADVLRDALTAGTVDLVTFASASAVAGYVEASGKELASHTDAVTIGPITSEAARRAGIPVVGEAVESTLKGLVDAVVLAIGARERP